MAPFEKRDFLALLSKLKAKHDFQANDLLVAPRNFFLIEK